MVEKEGQTTYDTMEYVVKKKWTLVISKTSDPSVFGRTTYRVQRKMSNGELRDLVGKPKVYLDKNCINPKILDYAQ